MMTALQHSQNREDARHSFLRENGIAPESLTFLAGDASFRKYYRISEKSLVLMDAPPPEAILPFIQVDNLLLGQGFSAPKILASDSDKGFILLEDFGDNTYTRLFKDQPSKEKSLYFLAIDTLIDLHQKLTQQPKGIKAYSPEIHLREALLLLDWTYPALQGKTASQSLKSTYTDLWENALTHTTKAPQSLVLRDYHVDNLIHLPNRPGIQACGLLDFQDALWGSVTYDIVSLLEDARRDVPETLIQECWHRYFMAFPSISPDELRKEAAILSAARHAKIIGIFTRLAVRDHKPHYLTHIPRVWKLLHRCLSHPDLGSLNQWFQENFPQEYPS